MGPGDELDCRSCVWRVSRCREGIGAHRGSDWDLAVDYRGTRSTPPTERRLFSGRRGPAWLGARSGRYAVAIMSPGGSSGGWRLRSWTVPRRERERRAPDPDRVDHRSSWAIVEYVAPDGSVPVLEEHASPLRPAGGAAASASVTVGIGAHNDAHIEPLGVA